MVYSKEVMLEVSAARVEVLVRLKIQNKWRGSDWPANFPFVSPTRDDSRREIEMFSCQTLSLPVNVSVDLPAESV